MEREADFWNITVPLNVVKLGTVVRFVSSGKKVADAPDQFGHIVGFATSRRRKPFADGYETHEDVLAARVQFSHHVTSSDAEVIHFDRLELI